MNIKHRILFSWAATWFGLVMMLLGYGFWFLLVAAFTSYGLHYKFYPKVPNVRRPLLSALLLAAFGLALIVAHSPVTFTRVVGWCLAGGIAFYLMCEDLRFYRQNYDVRSG